MGKSLTEAHVLTLSKKGETSVIKGLAKGDQKINAKLKLTPEFGLTYAE
jgi:hypothetical protein